MSYYLGIDIGGTNIACGVVSKDYEVLGKSKIKTQPNRSYGEILKDIISCADLAIEYSGISRFDLRHIGVGCPGAVDPKTGIVHYASNLNFVDAPLGADLKQEFRLPVYVENDANAAALGEWLAGAAKNAKNAVIITLGTGIGAGIIINGRLYSGSNCCGGEIGHTVIQVDGEPCPCGRNGCFEAYCSATALVRMTRKAISENPDSGLEKAALDEGRISARTAFSAMRQGDELGKSLVETYIKYLAAGIANVINVFQPDILAIGGGVSNEGEALLTPLKEQVARQIYTKNLGKNTEIVTCRLANHAGIIGAALLGISHE